MSGYALQVQVEYTEDGHVKNRTVRQVAALPSLLLTIENNNITKSQPIRSIEPYVGLPYASVDLVPLSYETCHTCECSDAPIRHDVMDPNCLLCCGWVSEKLADALMFSQPSEIQVVRLYMDDSPHTTHWL